MYEYNFATMLWDYFHLGLYDLLSAFQMEAFKLSDEKFKVFYWDAMEIALKGKIIKKINLNEK